MRANCSRLVCCTRVGKVRTREVPDPDLQQPGVRQIWAGLSDAQRAEGFARYAALNEELAATGELIVSEALADPSLAKRVSVRGAFDL